MHRHNELRKAVEAVFPSAKKKVTKKLFLVGREKSIGNTLKHWREPILNNHTTNGFTEGCHTSGYPMA